MIFTVESLLPNPRVYGKILQTVLIMELQGHMKGNKYSCCRLVPPKWTKSHIHTQINIHIAYLGGVSMLTVPLSDYNKEDSFMILTLKWSLKFIKL